MPYANLDDFDHDRRLSAIPDLFTVDLVARYVARKLGQGIATGAEDHGVAGISRNSSPVYQE